MIHPHLHHPRLRGKQPFPIPTRACPRTLVMDSMLTTPRGPKLNSQARRQRLARAVLYRLATYAGSAVESLGTKPRKIKRRLTSLAPSVPRTSTVE